MPAKRNSSERELLRMIRALSGGRANKSIRIGIGDDCAVLRPRPVEEIVVTTDFSVQDRHFRLGWHPPEAIGYKCLARGLSDIAAMGARPMAAFVSLAVPRALAEPQDGVLPVSRSRRNRESRLQPSRIVNGTQHSWIERFYVGLLALADRERVTLAGGDLSESPTAAIADIVLVGAAPKGRALLRSTARAGDILYVTGTLGGAAAELAALEAGGRFEDIVGSGQLAHPHFFPQPRSAVGQALLWRRLATACIDISDGLSVDLMHLCEESGLDAELKATSIPIAAAATLEQALHGGDDYELLFTARAGTRVPRRIAGVAVTAIGHVSTPRQRVPRVFVVTPVGKKARRTRLRPQGWEHF